MKRAQWTPDVTRYNPDPIYIGQLIDATGLSQLELAARLGVSDRIVRYWTSGEQDITYLAQFALECLAGQRMSCIEKITIWP